ncbi:glycosyltransferase family 9 protein [Vibrio sp. SCSIO 43135]|uniref:glycosyltransferase family 9 protein n=1 Tax=Vibrio sp. SCSIO 43135 TaxID=2819096 RepID=UPI002075E72F|nr:glycosyltransferase family 9 protein [Vibrio sp. SCSIO 43135]USD41273.1 glycosyltransferase family 9 protein [Vibrio sp. SCSIO 43135]
MSRSNNFKKILVIATHCIGDSLLVTVFTHSLRAAYPDATIDVLVNSRGKAVFESNPDIDNVVEISRRAKLGEYLRLLRDFGRYDLTVNERLNDRTLIYSLLFGRKRLGPVHNKLKGAWLRRWAYNFHITERDTFEHKMSRMARMLDLIDVDVIPRLVSPEETIPLHVMKRLPERYVVIHTPSSNEIKQWPVEHWSLVIEHLLTLGYKIVLTGAPSSRDRDIVKGVLEAIPNPSHSQLYNALGDLTLAQMSMLIKNSDGFIGPDSGPGHMASGFPIPIITLISVAPASVWAPWPYGMSVSRHVNLYTNGRLPMQRQGNVMVLQSIRGCVPCFKNKCAISDDVYSPCLQDITPDQVVRAIQEMIPLKEL